ncbi:MAG: hypothetical protein ACNA7K_02060 [Acholeplasmataceae bacterium]
MIYTTFTEGIFISIFSVLIVFAILSVIALAIYSLKYIHENPPKITLPSTPDEIPFSIDDITDDDMMVAALVASIDYQEQTKEDVRVTRIRKIQG